MKTHPHWQKDEGFDVRTVHGQLLREKGEPHEILRRAPRWLVHGIYAPLLIWGLWYLLVASGGFRWNEYYEGFKSTVNMAARSENSTPPPSNTASPEPDNLSAEGKAIYRSICVACHQPNGMGLPGAFPPLAGSDWVAGSDKRLAAIVLHGLMGPIEVKGQPWNSVMPPQGPTLDDRQIAAVLSYVRSEWGNTAAEVSPETVSTVRTELPGHAPWTADSLEREIAP